MASFYYIKVIKSNIILDIKMRGEYKTMKIFNNKSSGKKKIDLITQETKEKIQSDVVSRRIVNSDTINKVAALNVDTVIGLANEINNTTLITNPFSKNSISKPNAVIDKSQKQFYEKAHKFNFFENIRNAFATGKVQTPQELMEMNIKTNLSLNKDLTSEFTSNYNNLKKLKEMLESNTGEIIAFDTETINGVNKFGHNELNHITEVAVSKYDIGTKTYNNYSTILGFDERRYREAMQMAEGIKNNIGDLTPGSIEKVFFDRMNIYSQVKYKQAGAIFELTDAKDIKEINTSYENMVKGIELLRKVGKAQELKFNETGMSFDEGYKNIIKSATDMIQPANKNSVVVSQNGISYDNEVLKKVTGKAINTSNHLDILQINMASQAMGHGGAVPSHLKTSGQFGRNTQENIIEAYGLKRDAAHMAIVDAEALNRLFTETDYLSHLEGNADFVNNKLSKTAGTYIGKNQVFYLDKTQQASKQSKDGALNFAYDPLTKTMKTFDGYGINDNNINDFTFNQYGAKSNTLVTHDVRKVTKADIEGFDEIFNTEKLFQDIKATEEFYVIKTDEYIDEALLRRKVGDKTADFILNNKRSYYTIETNPDKIGNRLGVALSDGDGNLIKEAVNALGINTLSTAPDGTIDQTTYTDGDAVWHLKNETINRNINDSAARKVRGGDYSFFYKHFNFYNSAKQKDGRNPIVKAALQYAEAISTNTTLDLDIQKQLGFSSGGKQILYPETVRNAVSLEPFLEAYSPAFNKIEEILDETYGKIDMKNIDKSSSKYLERNIAFKQLFNEVVSSTLPKHTSTNTVRDVKKADFKTSIILPEKYKRQISTGSNIEDITTFDLGNPDSIFNFFFREKFKDNARKVDKNGSAGWDTLKTAVKSLSKDERYEELHKLININNLREEGYSVPQASEKLTNVIKSSLLHDRNYDYVIGKGQVVKEQAINDALEIAKQSLRKPGEVISVNGKKKEEAVQALYNHILNYNEDDLYKQASALDSNSQKTIKLLNKQAKTNARTLASDIVNAIATDEEISLAITKSNGSAVVSLIQNNEAHELNLPRFTANNGMIMANVNDNNYALKLALGIDKSNGTKVPIMTNNYGKAIRKNSIYHNMKWANNRGDSSASGISTAVKNMSKAIAESSTRFNNINGQVAAQSLVFDVNDLVNLLPTFRDNGILGLIESQNTDAIKEDTIKAVNGIIKQVEATTHGIGDKAFSALHSKDLNHFTAYLPGLLEVLGQNTIIDGIELHEQGEFREIFNIIGERTKNTSYREGKMSLGDYYMSPLAVLDKESRQPMTQMANTVLYNKDKVVSEVNKLNSTGYNVGVDPIATNKIADAFLYNNKSKRGTVGSSGLTVDFLQINSYEMQRIFQNDMLDINSKIKLINKKFGDHAAEQLYNKMAQLSTYEQEAILNSRVSDIAASRFETQKINSNKVTLGNVSNPLELHYANRNVKDLDYIYDSKGFKYNKGRNVKKGEVLGLFGKDPVYAQYSNARYDGLFRGVFTDEHGIAVTEKEINSYLSESTSNVDDIQSYLKNKYNLTFNYEVVPFYEQHGMKIQLGPSEKTTAQSSKMAVGSLSKDVKTALSQTSYSHLIGKVANEEYYQMLIEDIKAGRVSGGEELINLLDQERHAVSDTLQLFDKFKGKGVISAVNMGKHNSTSVLIESYLEKLKSKGLINQKNMNFLFGEGNFELLEDGRVNLSIDKVNLNFGKEQQHLKDVLDEVRGEFAKGEGRVSIIQTYDDISGTSAGLKDPRLKLKLANAKNEARKARGKSNAKAKYEERLLNILDLEDGMKADVRFTDKAIKEKQDKVINQMLSDIEQTKQMIKSSKESKNKLIEEKNRLTKVIEKVTDKSSSEYRNAIMNIETNSWLIDEEQAKINEYYKDIDMIGKSIGITKDSSIDQMTDYRKSIGLTDILSYKDKLFKEINNLSDADSEYYSATKRVMDIEEQIINQNNFKGLKFSEAMGQNLDRQKVNADLFGKLKSELSEEEFNRYFGRFMKDGILDQEQIGKRLAGGVTDRLRRNLFTGGAETLEDILNSGDRELIGKYKYLFDSIDSSTYHKLGVDQADAIYSFVRGEEALKYNSAGRGKAILNTSNFKGVDINELDLDIGGIGRSVLDSDTNPYSNNLLVSTGLKPTDFNNPDDYYKYADIAVSRMPIAFSGDSIQKAEHMKTLGTIKDIASSYHGEVDPEKRATHLGNLKSAIDNFKLQQRAGQTSKTGLIKELTEQRMDQSFFGTASGVNVMSFDENGGNLFGALKNVTDDVERKRVIKTLEDSNAFLTGLKYNGTSVLEHYAEGKALDMVFVNENTFEAMGYFNDERLRETFSSLSTEYEEKLNAFDINTSSGRRDAMKHLLSTEGDSIIATRYPEIRNTSNKFSQIYLNNDLKDNEIRVMGSLGMGTKLDHDGDKFAAALLNSENGLSYLMNRMSLHGDDNFNREVDAVMMSNAVTHNRYWEDQVQKQIIKEGDFASSVSEMREIAGKRFVDGQIHTTVLGKQDLDIKELQDLTVKYRDVIKTNYNKNDLTDMDLVSDILKANSFSEEEIGLMDIDARKQYVDEYVAAWAYNDAIDTSVAKVYQAAVGETNVTNSRVKQVVSALIDPNDPEYEYKQQVVADFLYRSEEQAISSKTSIEGLEPERAAIWNRATMGVLKGQDIEENKAVMREWLTSNVKDEAFIESYYARSSAFTNKMNDMFSIDSYDAFSEVLKDSANKDKVTNMLVNDVVETIAGFSGEETMGELLDTLRIGTSRGGVSDATSAVFLEHHESNLKAGLKMAAEAMPEHFNIQEVSSETVRAANFSNAFESGHSKSNASILDETAEGIVDLGRKLTGSALAKSAIGVAAGVMIAGFVGGRPRPADVHAMEEAEDYEGGYTLADPGLNMSDYGGQQGYVININAKTDKGRDNAVKALEQAIQNGTSSSINIAMNITDNYGNINDRKIQEAIEGAFR